MKHRKLYIFIFGIILTLFGILFEILNITVAIEGYETEESKLGGIVLGFLMMPVTISGIYMIVKHRPKRRTKRIATEKILEIIQKKKHHLYKRDLAVYLNLSDVEAGRLLKEIKKIGLLKINKRNYTMDQYLISEKTGDIMKGRKAIIPMAMEFMNKVGKLRKILCIFFITGSVIGIIVKTTDSCSDEGFYYLLFFSTLSILCSSYLVRNHRNKHTIPEYVEIVSDQNTYH